jgi:hypothetical protein
MKISEFIEKLESAKKLHGDLPIIGGSLLDDTPPTKVIALNSDGADVRHYPHEPVGFFIE